MGTAVVSAAKCDSPRTLGGGAGDFHRVFYRFRTGGHQQGFLGEITRHFLIHDFTQLQVRLIGQHLETGMGQLFQLRFYRRDDLRMQVTGVQHRNTASKVEEFTAFNVPNPTVFCPLGKNRVDLAYATGNGVAATLHKFFVGAHQVFSSICFIKGRCTYI